MGKSLREALAEQMTALRAYGLAPEVLPDSDEAEPPLPTNGYEADRPRRLGKRATAKRLPVRPPARTGAAHPAVAAPEPGAANGSPRPAGIGKLLERRADQRRQEQSQREEICQQLSRVRGSEVDDVAVTAFLRGLERETGALPPFRVVLEAMRDADSDNPLAVADAVRRYYRRPRPAAR